LNVLRDFGVLNMIIKTLTKKEKKLMRKLVGMNVLFILFLLVSLAKSDVIDLEQGVLKKQIEGPIIRKETVEMVFFDKESKEIGRRMVTDHEKNDYVYAKEQKLLKDQLGLNSYEEAEKKGLLKKFEELENKSKNWVCNDINPNLLRFYDKQGKLLKEIVLSATDGWKPSETIITQNWNKTHLCKRNVYRNALVSNTGQLALVDEKVYEKWEPQTKEEEDKVKKQKENKSYDPLITLFEEKLVLYDATGKVLWTKTVERFENPSDFIDGDWGILSLEYSGSGKIICFQLNGKNGLKIYDQEGKEIELSREVEVYNMNWYPNYILVNIKEGALFISGDTKNVHILEDARLYVKDILDNDKAKISQDDKRTFKIIDIKQLPEINK